MHSYFIKLVKKKFVFVHIKRVLYFHFHSCNGESLKASCSLTVGAKCKCTISSCNCKQTLIIPEAHISSGQANNNLSSGEPS